MHKLSPGCNEIDVADTCGPYGWEIVKTAMEKFPCGPCAEEGGRLYRFDRDFVTLKQGKKPFDGKNFLEITRRAVEFTHKFDLNPGRESADPNPHPKGTAPFGLTKCEGKHPEILAKIERCVQEVKGRPGVQNPFAVCRAAIPCPPR